MGGNRWQVRRRTVSGATDQRHGGGSRHLAGVVRGRAVRRPRGGHGRGSAQRSTNVIHLLQHSSRFCWICSTDQNLLENHDTGTCFYFGVSYNLLRSVRTSHGTAKIVITWPDRKIAQTQRNAFAGQLELTSVLPATNWGRPCTCAQNSPF